MTEIDPIKMVRDMLANSKGYADLSSSMQPLPDDIPDLPDIHFTEDDDQSETKGMQAERDATGRTFRETIAKEGWPYGSVTAFALDENGMPLILISALSEHTKNILVNNKVSLLVKDHPEKEPSNKMMVARVTLMGRAEKVDKEKYKATFLAKHSSAKGYIEFTDFYIYRINIMAARLVAGFAQAFWVEGEDVRTS